MVTEKDSKDAMDLGCDQDQHCMGKKNVTFISRMDLSNLPDLYLSIPPNNIEGRQQTYKDYHGLVLELKWLMIRPHTFVRLPLYTTLAIVSPVHSRCLSLYYTGIRMLDWT